MAQVVGQSSACYRPKPMMTQKPADGSMHFTIMKHPKEALEVMNALRRACKLCDVSLVVGTETLAAHKLVLAAASPYFKAMFTGGMREEEMTTIPLHGISPCTLSTLIDFAYTAEIHISEGNVCFLLPAATMFQMSHVVEACSVFLEHQLDPNNCIGIADFASEHGCMELEQKARKYILKHFCEVIKSEEFLTLSFHQVINLLKQDELNIKCESEVYQAVMNYDPETDTWTPISSMVTRRIGVGCAVLNRLLFAVGGFDGQNRLSSVECYDPERNEWRTVASMNTMRSGAGVIGMDSYVYAVGGYDSTCQLRSVERYNLEKNCWEFVSPMNSPRSALSVAVICNKLYALGGYDGTDFLTSVEMYDPTTNEWTEVTNMPWLGVWCWMLAS
nr:hypothetical protein BaRGS_010922 [Batillaria attramentaria]